jgi:hypothetical protein
MELLQVLAPTMSKIMVLFGIIFIWHSRLAAYQMFQYAVLVSILLTQVFAFYEDQLLGVLGLIPNLVILAILRFLISTATVKDVNGERDRNSRISQIPDIPKNTTQNRL